MDTVKPIIKWVGGKTQILDKLFANFPTKINNYHEIFLGGGSVLLTLLSQVGDGKIKVAGTIHAYDINEPLIYVYKNIQTQHTAVYAILQTMIGELNACRMSSCFFSSRLKIRISPTSSFRRKRLATALPKEPVPPVMSSVLSLNMVESIGGWVTFGN